MLWIFLGGLLALVVGINVLIVRTLRAERQRETSGDRDRSRRHRQPR